MQIVSFDCKLIRQQNNHRRSHLSLSKKQFNLTTRFLINQNNAVGLAAEELLLIHGGGKGHCRISSFFRVLHFQQNSATHRDGLFRSSYNRVAASGFCSVLLPGSAKASQLARVARCVSPHRHWQGIGWEVQVPDPGWEALGPQRSTLP